MRGGGADGHLRPAAQAQQGGASGAGGFQQSGHCGRSIAIMVPRLASLTEPSLSPRPAKSRQQAGNSRWPPNALAAAVSSWPGRCGSRSNRATTAPDEWPEARPPIGRAQRAAGGRRWPPWWLGVDGGLRGGGGCHFGQGLQAGGGDVSACGNGGGRRILQPLQAAFAHRGSVHQAH